MYLLIGASFELFSLGALGYAALRCGLAARAGSAAVSTVPGASARTLLAAPAPPPHPTRPSCPLSLSPLTPGSYSTNADAFLAAVQDIAGASSGLGVVEQAKKAVNM